MMAGNAKVATALVGGYVLGRTKKGRAAIRVALWLSNNKGLVDKVTQTPEAAQLVGQVQGPLLEALQKAALSTATARMGKLSQGLTARTEALGQVTDLTEGLGSTVSKTGKSVGGTVKGVTGKLHKPKQQTEDDSAQEDQGGEQREEGEQNPEQEQGGEQHAYKDDPEYQAYLDWKQQQKQSEETEETEEEPEAGNESEADDAPKEKADG